MKKILCLIDTLGFGGGAERQMIGLVQMLRKRGYPVDVVVYHDCEDYPEIKRRYKISPILLHVKKSPLSKLLAVRKYVNKFGNFDWIITYKTGPNVIGCLLKLLGGKFRLMVSERNTTQSISKKEQIQFRLYRLADYVVPNSFSQTSFINKHFPWLRTKTVTITNFTDTNVFIPADNTKNDNVKILTVGRISRQKNISRYIDAIDILVKRGVRNVHFDWVGKAHMERDKTYAAEIQKKIETLNLSNFFSFHPQTLDIVKYYQTCDIFCLPSNYEGFPNVICEAMSCGKPIVCSNVCDNPYIVKEGKNALMFDPNNVADMADILWQICSMTQEVRLQWGQRSREIAEEILSMEAFVDKYIELIER